MNLYLVFLINKEDEFLRLIDETGAKVERKRERECVFRILGHLILYE